MFKITSENDNLLLTCTMTGDDITGGYWERVNRRPLNKGNNDSSLSLSNGNTIIQLNVTRVRPKHSGMYCCVAYSQWGVAQSGNVQVTITSESNNVRINVVID